jgi:hypothetical protein
MDVIGEDDDRLSVRAALFIKAHPGEDHALDGSTRTEAAVLAPLNTGFTHPPAPDAAAVDAVTGRRTRAKSVP